MRRSVLVLLLTLFTFTTPRFSAAATDSSQDASSTVEASGTLDVIVLDDFVKHRSDMRYRLHDSKTKKQFDLRFQDGQTPKDLKTGMRIKVKGKQSGSDIFLKRSDLQIESAETAAAPVAKTMAVILVNFQDSTVTCGDSASCNAAMFAATNSVNDVDRETSYNNINVTGNTFGPYTISAHAADGCAFDQWGTLAETEAQNAGVDLTAYTYHQFIMPQSSTGQCGYAGLAYVGGTRSWIFNYCQCTDVMAHEFGHNLGMLHASTETGEYEDISDYMGYSCVGLRGVNGPHREEMQWLPASNIQTLTSSGTYTIAALPTDPAATANPQLLKFHKPDIGDHYYLSYRTAVGYDTLLNNMAAGYAHGVNIHHWPGYGNTKFVQVLADGGTFTDSSNGITIHQVSHDSSGAIVNVSIKPATATISPASIDFGTVAINSTSSDRTATLTNTGTTVVSFSDTTITGTNQSDFRQRLNSCVPNLPAGGSCTVTLAFSPSATGPRSATLSIYSNATTSPHQVSLTGTGSNTTPPAVSFNPTSLSFGAQIINTTSASKPVSLKNTGGTTLNISSIVASSKFAISSKTCGTTLAPNIACIINLTFRPTATGAVTGSLTISDNAGGSPHKVALSGSGTKLKLSPTSLAYATQVINSASAAKKVTLTNVDSTSLSITSTSVSTHFVITSKTCGASLAAGASCSINVGFRPTSIGSKTGNLSIYNNGGVTPRTIPLSGAGTQVKLSASGLTFAPRAVGTTSGTQSVTVTNVGSTNVSISSIAISGDFAIASKNCGSSLAHGASCAIAIRFHPTAKGTRTGTLNIYNSGGGSPRNVALTGTGT